MFIYSMTLEIFHGVLNWENIIPNHYLSCLEPRRMYTYIHIPNVSLHNNATLPAHDDSVSAGAAPLSLAKQVYQRQYG